MTQKTESEILALLGRDRGLNADWSVSAWYIGRNHWLTDGEDGTVSIMHRLGDQIREIATVPETNWKELIS